MRWKHVLAALLAWGLHSDELDHHEKETDARRSAVVEGVLQRGIDEGVLDAHIDKAEAMLLQLDGPAAARRVARRRHARREPGKSDGRPLPGQPLGPDITAFAMWR